MSRDQKPGKARVVGGARPEPASAVPTEGAERRAAGGEAGSADASVEGGAESLLVPLIVFLIACAIGGAAVALLGLGR